MDSKNEPVVVTLPENMDLKAATPLAAQILAIEGRALVLDASSVRRLGALGLQVLLSARRSWAEANAPMRIVNPSPAFKDGAELLGATFILS
jgi:chemotaxis protein CheX